MRRWQITHNCRRSATGSRRSSAPLALYLTGCCSTSLDRCTQQHVQKHMHDVLYGDETASCFCVLHARRRQFTRASTEMDSIGFSAGDDAERGRLSVSILSFRTFYYSVCCSNSMCSRVLSLRIALRTNEQLHTQERRLHVIVQQCTVLRTRILYRCLWRSQLRATTASSSTRSIC